MGNSVSTLPYDSQSASIHTYLTCDQKDPLIFKQFPEIALALTAPLTGGQGQDVYLSDLSGTIESPLKKDYPSQVFPNGYYLANISICLSLTNAAPTQLCYNGTYRGQFDDKPLVIQGTGPLPAIGPVTLGALGAISDISIASAYFNVVPHNQDNTAFQPFPVACSGYPDILSSIGIDDSKGEALAPSTGTPGGPAPFYFKTVTANIPQSCKSDLRTGPYNYSIAATMPVNLGNGTDFTLTDVEHFITVPGTFLGATELLSGGKTSAAFVDTRFGGQIGATLSGAVRSSFDMATDFTNASDPDTPKPLVTGLYYDRGSTSDIAFPLPKRGSLSYGGLTATNASDVFSLRVDEVDFSVDLYSADSGNEVLHDRVRCTTIPALYSLLRSRIINVPVSR